jgi:hypothetical protein
MRNNRIATSVVRVAVVAAVVVSFAGCTKVSTAPTSAALTPTPKASATAVRTATPTPTTKPSASVASASPTSPSTSPTATGGAPTAICTGTAEHLAFFQEAAKALTFSVYCASLPAKWWLSATEYRLPNGGYLTISYQNTAGNTISVGEGNFCVGLPDCWTSVSDLGSANFGSMSGSLKQLSGGQFAVFVNPGTAHGYRIVGKGMSQASFVAIAAGMIVVSKVA